ncbi:MAG: hypothetical protein AB1696_21810 [Planctomycetota bacterium]
MTYRTTAILLLIASCCRAQDEITLRWKIPKGTIYTYEYEERITKVVFPHLGERRIAPTRDGVVIEKGTIVVTCMSDRAIFAFDIMETPFEQAKSEHVPRKPPACAKAVLLPEGTDKDNRADFLHIFFPLPLEPLREGKGVKQGWRIPISGEESEVKGDATYTHRGTEVVKGRKCADYHVSYALRADIDTPDQKNRVRVGLAGEMDCLFATEEGYFLSVKADRKSELSLPEQPGPASTIQFSSTTLILKKVEHTDSGR